MRSLCSTTPQRQAVTGVSTQLGVADYGLLPPRPPTLLSPACQARHPRLPHPACAGPAPAGGGAGQHACHGAAGRRPGSGYSPACSGTLAQPGGLEGGPGRPSCVGALGPSDRAGPTCPRCSSGGGGSRRLFWRQRGAQPALSQLSCCLPRAQAVFDVLCPLLQRRFGGEGAALAARAAQQLQAVERDVLEVRCSLPPPLTIGHSCSASIAAPVPGEWAPAAGAMHVRGGACRSFAGMPAARCCPPMVPPHHRACRC